MHFNGYPEPYNHAHSLLLTQSGYRYSNAYPEVHKHAHSHLRDKRGYIYIYIYITTIICFSFLPLYRQLDDLDSLMHQVQVQLYCLHNLGTCTALTGVVARDMHMISALLSRIVNETSRKHSML